MASRISGLGYGQVGKFPSGVSCSGTTVTWVTPSLASSFFYALQAGAVQRGVHQLELLNAGAIANALVIYSLYKIIQAFVVNAHNAACLHTGFIIHQLYAVKAVTFSIAARILSATSSVIWQPSAP